MKDNRHKKQDEIIKLDKIDTKIAAENLAKYLNENKTYFLNGAWGAGKTQFIHKAEKKAKEKYRTKYVYIDFWQEKDKRTVFAQGVLMLCPLLYWAINILGILAIVVSILMTDVVNVGLVERLELMKISKIVLQIAGITVLIVTVVNFLKVESDWIYYKVLSCSKFKRKVLVIDDFDRISSDKQKEIYKLFNFLNGKLPIIFLGDYDNITENEGNYLQKIIDRRIELPFNLHPENLWEEYFNNLEIKLKDSIDDSFKRIVISEQRNLRERKHFNDYVNQEFFCRGKLNHVQVNQQLIVIYIYLFHPSYYKKLVNNIDIDCLKEKDSPLS